MLPKHTAFWKREPMAPRRCTGTISDTYDGAAELMMPTPTPDTKRATNCCASVCAYADHAALAAMTHPAKSERRWPAVRMITELPSEPTMHPRLTMAVTDVFVRLSSSIWYMHGHTCPTPVLTPTKT